MELRLLATRHGETAWSRERRFAGSKDIPLTPEGRRQGAALAQALAGASIAAVYASPLARARESAEPLAAAQGLPLSLEPDFREMSFGDWEGLTRDDVALRFPEDYAVWRAAPERFARPGGEPLTAVAERVARALAALRSTHDKQTVVLVSHGVVTRLLVLAALGLGPERLWSVEASPAGISEIEYRDDWVTLHRVNTLAHLDSWGASEGPPSPPHARSAPGNPGRSSNPGPPRS
jgi:broad specificity phosphatase PhoE